MIRSSRLLLIALLFILGFDHAIAKDTLARQGGIGDETPKSGRIDNVLFVDGEKFRTLGAALAACAMLGCVVYDNVAETFARDPFDSLPANVFAEVHLMRNT